MGRQPPDEPPSRVAALSAAIFIVALFVRVFPMGLYVTPDEPIWVMRSVDFLQAVQTGDLAAVPQTGHPGITTMALGALGVRTMTLLAPEAAASHLDWIDKMAWLAPENAAAFSHLAFFLPAGRLLVAIATSAGVVGAYHLGYRRVGSRAARWMALLLALDPFLAGHSGLLHTDALQATFGLLAVLFLMPRVGGGATEEGRASRLHEVVSVALAALCLALCGLTKTLGLLVAPGLAVAVLLWGEGKLRHRLMRVVALTLLTALVYAALTPAFWVAPRTALASLVGAIGYHESIGLRPITFLGEVTTDPGPAFYALVVLFRMTPPVFLGVVSALSGGGRNRRSSWQLLRWGGLIALVYVVALTYPAKKFDRYILTAMMLLMPVAASVWARARRACGRVALGLLGLGWATVAVVPLHYASPLLGGPWIADGVIPLGWGEAWGLAARKLNQVSPAPEMVSVLTKNTAGTAPLFAGETWPWTDAGVGCTDAIIGQHGALPAGYTRTDQVTHAGRELAAIYAASPAAPSPLPILAPGPLPGLTGLLVPAALSGDTLSAWLNSQLDPADVFLWVDAPNCYPLSSAQLNATVGTAQDAGQLTCEPAASIAGFGTKRCQLLAPFEAERAYVTRFAGVLDLASVTWSDGARAPDHLTIHLRWLPHTDLGDLDVYLALITGEGVQEVTWAEGGHRLVNSWGWPTSEWAPGTVTDGGAYVAIPLDLPPGTYTLVMSLAGADGWLGHTQGDGAFGGVQVVLGEVDVLPPAYPPEQLDGLTPLEADWPGIRIVGVGVDAREVFAGHALAFSLGLENHDGPAPDRLLWNLVCGTGSGQGGELDWSQPDALRYRTRFAPRLAPDHPEGDCTLSVWPATSGSDGPVAPPVVVGEVSVVQRTRTFSPPQGLDIPMSVAVGAFAELLGADVPATVLQTGEALPLTLYWRAIGPAEDDYTVFVHLVDADDRAVAQSDAWPSDGSAPTTTWLEGEIVADHHSLIVPESVPDGEYQLFVGMYDARRGPRQQLSAGGVQLASDRVYLGSIEVSR